MFPEENDNMSWGNIYDLVDDFSRVLTMTRTFFNKSLVTRKTQQAGGIELEADDGDFDPEDKQLVDSGHHHCTAH